MKWVMSDDGRWYRAPFIRDGKGDKPMPPSERKP